MARNLSHGQTQPNPGMHWYGKDILACACWCGARMLKVPAAEIREGRTGTCSTPACQTKAVTP